LQKHLKTKNFQTHGKYKMINEMKYKEARKMLCRYLYELAKEKGISQDKIAEKTGFNRNNVSRMLSGRYSPSLDNFIRLAEAVDTYFFINKSFNLSYEDFTLLKSSDDFEQIIILAKESL